MGNYHGSMIYRVNSEGIEKDEDVIVSFNTIFKDGYNTFCQNFKAQHGQEIPVNETLSFVKSTVEKLPHNHDLYVASELADLYNIFTDTLKMKKYLILKTTINLDGELVIKSLSGQEISVDDAIAFINDNRIYEEAKNSFEEHKKEMENRK